MNASELIAKLQEKERIKKGSRLCWLPTLERKICMNIGELLRNIKDTSFSQIVSQTEVATEAQRVALENQGYSIPLLLAEFIEKFPEIDPENIYYTPVINMPSFYFNKNTLASCPFRVDLMLANIGMITPEGVKAVIAECEAEVDAGRYELSLMNLPDRMKLEYFTKLLEKRSGNATGLYKLFFDIYNEADYGFRGMDKATLGCILGSKTKEDKLRTANAVRDLPETVTIYRGGNTLSAPYKEGYSWTLDINVANFFACKCGEGPGYLVKGKIRKSDIIEAFLDERFEQEIIADPQDVHIYEIIPIYGADRLRELIPAVSRNYRTYYGKMMDLNFTHESEIHGREHTARVLLLTQLIAEMEELCQADKETLAEAAIFHDTRRTHDFDDPWHGIKATEYYRQTTKNPQKMVEILCAYHALPDKEGEEAVNDYFHSHPGRMRAQKLLNIFKDADALDRVRFRQIGEPDLNQLRLPVSQELGLVAKLMLEQLTF